MIASNIANFVWEEHKAKTLNYNLKEFKIYQEVAIRNYIPGAKMKMVGIIARQGKLHYRIKVGANICNLHVD